MDETPKRLTPTREIYRELLLKSGNLCAFPGCTSLLITEDGTFVGQLCHIEAAEAGGERFSPTMTNDERRAAANLMLMCYPHHVMTNDVGRYTVAALREMKTSHERRFAAPDRELRERISRLNWTALVAAGLAAGLVLDDLARHVTNVLDRLLDSNEGHPEKLLRLELEDRLRYVRSGAIYWDSEDRFNEEVAAQLLAIFDAAGWKVGKLPAGLRFRRETQPASSRSALMFFVIGDENQVANSRAAIFHFFEACGFSVIDPQEGTLRGDHEPALLFRIVIVTAHTWSEMNPKFRD